ncbi:MAG: hypothetical protein CMJ49_05355 [Planctomycetaceae bacterium]|nr:hypothetical protein [Planctomycetaceae bacterium]
MNIHRVLVTGASGYLAGFVIDRLRHDHDLTLFDRVPPGEDRTDLRFVEGDVTSEDDVRRACADQDAVVHTIALVRERMGQPAAAFAEVMVKGTWHVAEACVEQEVKRLVNVSSIVAIGPPHEPDMPHDAHDGCRFTESDLHYCLAKHIGEDICDAYHQAHGLDVIHLRPGVIAGDGLNPGPSAPDAPRDHWFMYVDPRDVAQSVEAALAGSVSHGRFNIVAGRDDSAYEWRSAARELGYHPQHNWPNIPLSGGAS